MRFLDKKSLVVSKILESRWRADDSSDEWLTAHCQDVSSSISSVWLMRHRSGALKPGWRLQRSDATNSHAAGRQPIEAATATRLFAFNRTVVHGSCSHRRNQWHSRWMRHVLVIAESARLSRAMRCKTQQRQQNEERGVTLHFAVYPVSISLTAFCLNLAGVTH